MVSVQYDRQLKATAKEWFEAVKAENYLSADRIMLACEEEYALPGHVLVEQFIEVLNGHEGVRSPKVFAACHYVNDEA